jgi:hypothetical protein
MSPRMSDTVSLGMFLARSMRCLDSFAHWARQMEGYCTVGAYTIDDIYVYWTYSVHTMIQSTSTK